ncbi:hypothetical protein BS47DRAFT_315421 [Hydnum rufescens UP504]|uniref:Uncharacterized protein n=1 Tax=Hydnum rufescens UP504 TaxID=1448309 RepID=A0A9P6AK50_9AGAM|nr:hypothetical protein BS47DRAFT_315421 [Hydnum rufescens UP504]
MTSAQRPPSPSPLPKSFVKPLARRREASPNPQQLRTPPISNASVEPSDVVPIVPPSSVRKASPSQRKVKQQKLKFDLIPQYSDDDLSSRRQQETIERSLSPSPPPSRVERYVSELRFSNSSRKRKRGRESIDLSPQGTSSDVEDPSQADNDIDPLERFSDIDEQYPSSQFAADNVSEGGPHNIDEPHPHVFAYSPEPWDQAEADVFSHPGPSSRAGSLAELRQSVLPMPYPHSTPLPHAPPQVHPPDPSVLAQVMYSLNYLAFSGYGTPPLLTPYLLAIPDVHIIHFRLRRPHIPIILIQCRPYRPLHYTLNCGHHNPNPSPSRIKHPMPFPLSVGGLVLC